MPPPKEKHSVPKNEFLAVLLILINRASSLILKFIINMIKCSNMKIMIQSVPVNHFTNSIRNIEFTQAMPWFPEDAVIIPECLTMSPADDNFNSLLKAPRILNDPVNCSLSKRMKKICFS